VGALAHGIGLHAQGPRQLVVGASLAQDERAHGTLIGREVIDTSHGGDRVVQGAVGTGRRYGAGGVSVGEPTPTPRGFDALYGLEVLEHSSERVTAQVIVGDEVKQPMGLVHGGLYATMAESMCSMATHLAVARDGQSAMGLSNQTSFLRPITQGTVHARARRLHRGASTWVWDVEISDDNGRLCALTRMTIAVRPTRPAPDPTG